MAEQFGVHAQRAELLPFLRKLLVAVGVGAVVVLAILLKDIWILAFAAVLVGIGLRSSTRKISGLTGLPHKWALVITCILVVGAIAATFLLAWPQIQMQIPSLLERIREFVNQIEANWSIQLPDTTEELSGLGDRLLPAALTILAALATVVASFLLVLVAGVFIAAEPRKYRHGLVLLFPVAWHAKVREALEKVGDGLLLWLRAQLVAMLVVGLLIGLGAWAIGLPSPLALGLIAGLTEFIPIIGPLLAILPAGVIAFSEGGSLFVATIVLYIVVQQFEGNLLMPLLQRRIVQLPPVLFLFSLVALGIVFGVGGIIIAAPLTVALYTLTRELYVKNLLKEGNLLKSESPQLKETLPNKSA